MKMNNSILVKVHGYIPGANPRFLERGGGGLKIIFTMGEDMGGCAPPTRGLVRFFTFPFVYM